MWRTRLARLSCLLVVSSILAACDLTGRPQVDHFAKARELAAEITKTTGKTDYSGSEWEAVALELQMVPDDAPNAAEADQWLKEIQQARHAKLFAVEERNGGSVAYKVKAPTGRTRSRAHGLPPPPAHIDVGAIERRVKGGGSSAYKGEAGHKTATSQKRHGGTVIIYTTSWCPVCKAAKAHLRSKGVSFIEKDVEKDPTAMAEKERIAPGSSVPVISVGGKILVGFDAAALDKML